MHIPPILIELELRQQLGVELPPSRVISGHFAIESAPLVSLELAGVSSEHPLGDTSVTTSETVVDTGRRSESFEIYDSSSRTIAEALFPILDCTTVRTSADGVSTLYVRLLSLKLDHPLESAYVKDCKYFSLSVELSERLIEKIPATDPESTGVSTTSSASECRADSSPLAQAAAETSNIQEGPSSGPGGTPSPRQDTIHDSPEPALSPTAISEQMAVFAEPGDPGPCDAEISVMHNGPDVNHTNGPAGVPSSPHESAQVARGPVMSLTRRPCRWLLARLLWFATLAARVSQLPQDVTVYIPELMSTGLTLLVHKVHATIYLPTLAGRWAVRHLLTRLPQPQ
ncbi:hypothetical protein C2E23DRAFT_565984 [Lenzites betulinus]|nr:hypothetical protein C2E23DRAFT_565984 [Lenzites betulinus]